MFDDNRRRYPRANYPCQLTLWMDTGLNETILANTSNIGLGGLCVHLNQGIREGTKVDIQLTFTNVTTPFRCRGVVVRCIQDSDKFYNVGIELEPLSELQHSFLSGKVSEIMHFEQKGKSG